MPDYTPLVSVIINTRNDVEYIRESIDSVYSQTYQQFEILVFDNASKVDIQAALGGYDERLRYHRSEVGLTLGAARNAALKLANGDLIDFLDADDLFLPHKLASLVPEFENQSVGLSFGISEHFEVNDGIVNIIETIERPNVSGDTFGLLLEQFFISWDTAMFRKSFLSKDSTEWFNEEFNICTDYDLFLRLAHDHGVSYVSKPLSRWRSHGSNLSKIQSLREPMEKLAMVPRILSYEPKLFEKYSKQMKRFLVKVHLAQGNYYWQQGLKSEAWACSVHAFLLTFNRSALIKLLLIPFCRFETGMKLKT